MKVKRFREDSMQKAMARVRAELGREAVLISSRRVDNQVEVLAARDYDPKLLDKQSSTAAAVAPEKPVIPDLEPTQNMRFELLADKEKKAEEEARKRKIAQERKALEKLEQAQMEQERKAEAQRERAERERDLMAKEQRERARQELEQRERARQELEKERIQAQALKEMQSELGRLRELFENEMAQLVWRDSRGGQQPARAALVTRLEMAGINHTLAARLVEKLRAGNDLDSGWQKAVAGLAKLLCRPAPDPLKNGGVIAMIGSTGVGKTTTAVKLAARFSRQYGRNQVALITTDDFRAGQREQLAMLASSFGLSVQVAASRPELEKALDSFTERKLVIVDTAGVNQRSMNLQDTYQELLAGDRQVSPFLVLSATVQESVTNESIRAFARLKPVSAIVTKTDENPSIGPIVSSLIRFKLPVAYVGTGQAIPEDLAYANREFFTRKINESYRDALAQLQRRKTAIG